VDQHPPVDRDRATAWAVADRKVGIAARRALQALNTLAERAVLGEAIELVVLGRNRARRAVFRRIVRGQVSRQCLDGWIVPEQGGWEDAPHPVLKLTGQTGGGEGIGTV